MPLQATSGAASYDAFGGGVPVEPNYIESVFSTFLYTGNGSTQTITNGIDLAGKGGLVWIKNRDTAGYVHRLFDSARGNNSLTTSSTAAQVDFTGIWGGLTSTGFSIAATQATLNESNKTYASWTFRKAPKFFDVVTYTGTGSAQNIAHNLGAVPGCIIVKKTNLSGTGWPVYHRSLGATQFARLDLTQAAATNSLIWNNTGPTSTQFTVGAANSESGDTYVAYLFAHNAGGFGLSGEDNVISCGSYTGNGSTSGPVTTLGYEPQWILIKNASATTGGWVIVDNMRGLPVGGNSNVLRANTSGAESTSVGGLTITATGFQQHDTDANFNASGNTYIYIAIRRGPMKTPTTGTSVFAMSDQKSTNPSYVSSFPVDMGFYVYRPGGEDRNVSSRLTSGNQLSFNLTAAQVAVSNFVFDYQNGWREDQVVNTDVLSWMFRRAPGFFDEVCYTGTGTTLTLNHNLGVKPELIILKVRSTTQNWPVYHNMTATTLMRQLLNSGTGDPNARLYSDGYGLSAEPTSTTISITPTNTTLFNGTGATYVAYLFASCPGVSKVFSYTGNGTSQTINCGFTGGARFVMIKRTDSTGNWMVADTARGLVAAGDPTLYLNSTAAEVTGVDWIDPDSSGFIVNQEGTMNANVNGGTYVGIAVA